MVIIRYLPPHQYSQYCWSLKYLYLLFKFVQLYNCLIEGCREWRYLYLPRNILPLGKRKRLENNPQNNLWARNYSKISNKIRILIVINFKKLLQKNSYVLMYPSRRNCKIVEKGKNMLISLWYWVVLMINLWMTTH